MIEIVRDGVAYECESLEEARDIWAELAAEGKAAKMYVDGRLTHDLPGSYTPNQ